MWSKNGMWVLAIGVVGMLGGEVGVAEDAGVAGEEDMAGEVGEVGRKV